MLIKTKFAISTVLAFLLILFIGALEDQQYKLNLKHASDVNTVFRLARKIYDLNFLTHDYMNNRSSRTRQQWLLQSDSLSESLATAKLQLIKEEDIIEDMALQLQTMATIFAKLIENENPAPGMDPALCKEACNHLASELLVNVRELHAKSLNISDFLTNETFQQNRRESFIILALLPLLAFMAVIIMFFAARSFFPRLKKLHLAFQEIGSGNLNYRSDDNGKDEIGSITASLNKTIADLSQITVSRHRLEEEIRIRIESQHRLEQVETALSEASDSVLMFDAGSLAIFYANLGALNSLGHDKENLSALRMNDLLPLEATDKAPAYAEQLGEIIKLRTAEVRMVHKNGASIPMEVSLQYIPATNESRSSSYYILISRDISDRKLLAEQQKNLHRELEEKIAERTRELKARAEDSELLNQAMVNLLEDLQTTNRELEETTEKLQLSNKELESFSYSVSHDLRAPLRHMSGFVDLLEKHTDAFLDDKSRHYIDIIKESSLKMGTLIDDLLYYSRTGRAEMKRYEVDLNPLVRDVVDELASQETGRDIDWQIGQLEPAYADGSLLRIVLANLLGNAVKFTRHRDRARITVGSNAVTGKGTVYFVRDNGAGFDMKYGNKLFGVFQRLHHDSEFEGTGIGLATVQRIIFRHGGRIWAEGAVGAGATFYFTIPADTIYD